MELARQAKPETIGGRVQSHAARLTGSPWFWLVFIGLLFAYPISLAMTRRLPEPPPVYFSLPEFTLTDQLGKPFGTADLQGKVWIADFMFTSCPTRCPELTRTMATVQKRMRNMGDAVYLVSFSVDPERDTPEKLFEYSQAHHANPRRWRFLTGDLGAMKDAIVKGFKMPMDPGEKTEDLQLFDITHGTRFVLVDQRGQVRGFYETDDDSIDRLVADLATIANLGS